MAARPDIYLCADSGGVNLGRIGLAPPMLYYAVHILPRQDWFSVNGRRARVSPGMTATIDVNVGKRSVLAFFTDPFTRYINTGLETR